MSDRFCLILGVSELNRSIAFYQHFLDVEPIRLALDRVRFERPEFVLMLVQRERVTVNNAPGLRLPTREAVLVLRERLHSLGIRTHTQECTHCGYNEQFRIHVGDPDGNYWYAYAVEGVIHPSTIHRCLEGAEAVLHDDPDIPHKDDAVRNRLVIYKGPFRQIRDDMGNVYPRGERIVIDEATWLSLRRGVAVEQFLFLFPFGYPEAGPVRPPLEMIQERP